MRPGHVHPVTVRITHWVGAAAILCMISSGWTIYNASPLLAFTFPRWATLGGWLAGGIAWHLAVLWVLVIDGLVYLAYGAASGHLRRNVRPRDFAALRRDVVLALTFRLRHPEGHYNAVQRLLYSGVLLLGIGIVLTGLAIWKPVQFGWLSWAFGGYDTARVLHFTAMAGLVIFLIVHLVLVALFPSRLVSMVTGGRRGPEPDGEGALR